MDAMLMTMMEYRKEQQKVSGPALQRLQVHFILQCYIMVMAWEMNERGVDLPVRISINTDNGPVYTEGLNKKYFNQTIILRENKISSRQCSVLS